MIVLKNQREKLNSQIAIPSEVHGYSLAVDFMQRWFFSRFNTLTKSGDGRDFFKTRYVNGKNVFDDFRVFNLQDNDTYIKRPKPIVIITPEPNFVNDRRGLKQYANMLGPDKLINRLNHNRYFFQDSERKIRICLGVQTLEVQFNFKVKVDSRAKQIDLYRFMQLNFREGDTQSAELDLDFHIPESIIYLLAKQSGFLDDNGNIINNMDFLAYMNMHSVSPITYKLRAINGKSEYFIRAPKQYLHINNTEQFSIDSGERVGKLDNNFTIEMNPILTIPIPYLFGYFTTEEIEINIPTVEFADLGLYTFKIIDIPDSNKNGWEKFASSEVVCDNVLNEGESESINIKSIFNTYILENIENCKKIYQSPSIFIDFLLVDTDGNKLKYKIHWDIFEIEILGPISEDKKCLLVVYMDNNYLNNNIINEMKLNESRLQ